MIIDSASGLCQHWRCMQPTFIIYKINFLRMGKLGMCAEPVLYTTNVNKTKIQPCCSTGILTCAYYWHSSLPSTSGPCLSQTLDWQEAAGVCFSTFIIRMIHLLLTEEFTEMILSEMNSCCITMIQCQGYRMVLCQYRENKTSIIAQRPGWLRSYLRPWNG